MLFFPSKLEDICPQKKSENNADSERTKERKQEIGDKQNDFKKLISALLNKRGTSVLIIHAEDPHYVDLYDRVFDDVLMDLVPDDSCFHDVFERLIIDENHVRIRIKSCNFTSCPLSTLHFHTSLSLNRGLDKTPNHKRMKRLLDNTLKTAHANKNDRQYCRPVLSRSDFEVGSEVKLPGEPENVQVPFQECMWLQAKRIRKTQKDFESLVNVMWTEPFELGLYIAAFLKVPGGGSILFGIKEQHNELCKTFIYEGVPLREDQHEELKQCLKGKILTQMLWVGPSENQDLAQFIDIGVTAIGDDRCIVEVEVHQFQGMCFFRKEGPEAYILDQYDQPAEVDWNEWARLSCCSHLKPILPDQSLAQ